MDNQTPAPKKGVLGVSEGRSAIQNAMMPQKQSFGAFSTVFGLLCRFIIALSGAYGTCLMLTDSFMLYKISGESELEYFPLLYACIGLCAAFAVCIILKNINRIAHITVSVLLGAAALVWAALSGAFGLNIILGIPTLWNYILTFLIQYGGYSQLSYFRVFMSMCDPSSNQAMLSTAYSFMVILICFVFVLCVMKKIRVVPVIITAGTVMTVSFTYNLINENYGFMFIISAAFGILVLKYYDLFFSEKRFTRKRKKEKSFKAEETANEGITPDDVTDDRTDEERFMDAYGIKYNKKKKVKKAVKPKKIKQKAAKPKEKVQKQKPDKQQLKEQLRYFAVSGIAAMLVFIITAGVMAYPATVTKEPWDDIPGLDDLMDASREFFYKIVSGEAAMDKADANFSYSGARSSAPTERNLTDKKLIQVDSNSNKKIYLRGWVGDIYENGEWKINLYEDFHKYDGEYMPEDSVELFYDIIDYTANNLSNPEYLDSNSRDKGFVSSLVSIKNIAIKSDMLYLPSRFSPSYGVLEYNSTDYTGYSGLKYGNHYATGMLVLNGNKTSKKAQYSTVAHIPYYDTQSFKQTMQNDIGVFRIVCEQIQYYGFANLNALREACEEKALAKGLSIPDNCIIYRAGEMEQSKLDRILSRIDVYQRYENCVNEICLKVPYEEQSYLLNDALTASGRTETFNGDESFKEIYDAIVNTVRWISDNTSYRLSPYGYVDDGTSYIYQFLHTAKNGYCVQYATSAIMLLRSLGLPARYVEGFSVGGFEKNEDEDTQLDYTAYAKDNDAHAWVEVFISGYGWMTFEATKPYINAMYGEVKEPSDDTGTAEPSHPSSPVTNESVHTLPAETEQPEETDGETTTEEGGMSGTISEETLRAVLIAAVIIILLITVLYLIMNTCKKKSEREKDLLHKTATKLNDSLDPSAFIEKYQAYIFRILKLCGLVRESNELLEAFAARVDAVFGKDASFAELSEALQKNAYGHCAGINECAVVAAYAAMLRLRAADKLPWHKKLFFKDIIKLVG